MPQSRDKVCIIGAGSSGIAAAKIFHEKNIPFDCFEKGSQIGGNWQFMNDNGQSAAYASLHINTSKSRMAYSDFPMPEEYPEYPHHSQIAKYFDDYVDHFGIRNKITFKTEVTDVSPGKNGTWRVTLDRSYIVEYSAVLVANGHHWDPRLPDFPGKFSGKAIHSHDYKTTNGFEGLNVLVVGIGNSAVDIACDMCRVARKTFLSTRRSAHVLPKYVFGKPIDHFSSPFGSYMPVAVQRLVFRTLAWLARGSQVSYGIPLPKHKLLQEHPTVSSDLLMRVGHGDIKMKPDIERLDGEHVRFVDSSSEKIDAIIYATGYKISFPFLKQDIFKVEENKFSLYHNVVHPELKNLYFIGFLQPLGATMPLAELQSKWVAGLVTGEYKLPEKATMQKTIADWQEKMRKRYISSPRHTIQVDFYPYVRTIKREME
jgi:hypothetical protein